LWGGVDVGGRRKGFHVAQVGERRLIHLGRAATVEEAVEQLAEVRLVAVDAPRDAARDGETSRACERELARQVCGIRWTPDDASIFGGNRYYEWIVCGLELYSALAGAGVEAVECFPTASWTSWGGARAADSRARWSARTLATRGLADVPRRLNQDQRDAIAAALTAREHEHGRTRSFGEIAVPLAR
jgi:predicted nuclease with RNAse H fold